MLEHQKNASVANYRNDAVIRPRRRALVAGINDYQSSANNLPSCINDVNAFVEVLQEDYAFDEIVRLVDSEATLAHVSATLRQLIAGATPDDRLVFFFSGHGSNELRDGVIKECVVLYDGFLFDDAISQMTQALPPGTLTLVMDCCFSGGLDKRSMAPMCKHFGIAQEAKVKAYTRPGQCVDHLPSQAGAHAIRRFGGPALIRSSSPIATALDPAIDFQDIASAPPPDKIGRVQIKGVLLSACRETETATASTASTEGKSAFTFALLRSLKKIGVGATLVELIRATASTIQSIGLTQTPLLKEPELPAGIRFRSFIDLAPKDVAD
ncbi:hypothetical protein AYJ54_17755 [Bradyrhizobium centrolobii]|nr:MULTISPECIES: caspase family protein [Bradyrhizobium]OAF07408.1 hypothetical protein AYJ54_17755 [Bradyrhizobium centrolobii]